MGVQGASSVAGALALGALKVPWYLDCQHSAEWTTFRKALSNAGPEFDDELFWFAQGLLERTEPIFLRVQNTKHMFYLCDPTYSNWAISDKPAEDSVFAAEGGTDQWSEEERERRSHMVRDFCYYGYMAAAAYRSRLIEPRVMGVMEGRAAALQLLETLVMSRSNCVDYLNDSGWPMRLRDVLGHLYPPRGPPIWRVPPEVTLDDTEIRQDWPPVQDTGQRRSSWRLAAVGYHTTLALELVFLWRNFLSDERSLEAAVHILEPGAGTAEEVRAQSLCRDFDGGKYCGWDQRLLRLNALHVGRGHLPRADLPSPQIQDLQPFLEDFAVSFGGSAPSAGKQTEIDGRLDSADLYLCTEPAVLCAAIGRAFPNVPLVGYFANPLASYVRSEQTVDWLAEFRDMALGHGRGAPFLAVASTRFLAEQMRFQTGANVLSARPLALYLGPPRGPKKQVGEVVVLRANSVFWNSACILNHMVRLNHPELTEAYAAAGSVGVPVPGLHFRASEELQDGASEAFTAFEAVVIYPYDVSQMRLYELYALAVPLFIPSRELLPSYIYRGMTTIDDFDRFLPLEMRRGEPYGRGRGGPHEGTNPFNRSSWPVVDSWTALTHWTTLPHLLSFSSSAQLLLTLTTEDLRPASAGMRRRQERDIVKAVQFWTLALPSLTFS